MKKIILIVFLFAAAACNGQKGQTHGTTKHTERADTLSNPKVDVRVNKKYDDKGNLIRLDSTYSYFYTSPGGQKTRIGSDTLFNNFKSYFHQNYDSLFNRDMNDIFWNDTLFGYDFFNEDYFSKRFEMNMDNMGKMLRRLDSLKTDYMLHSYPNGKPEKNNL